MHLLLIVAQLGNKTSCQHGLLNGLVLFRADTKLDCSVSIICVLVCVIVAGSFQRHLGKRLGEMISDSACHSGHAKRTRCHPRSLILQINQAKPECGRQTLVELLIRPVQRLPSVALLLNGSTRAARFFVRHITSCLSAA